MKASLNRELFELLKGNNKAKGRRRMISVLETNEKDLSNVQRLWADGDVMKFVGLPDGLQQTDEDMARWYRWIAASRPPV